MTTPQYALHQVDPLVRAGIYVAAWLLAGLVQAPGFGRRLRHLAANDDLCRFEHDNRCWWFSRTFLVLWPAWWAWYYLHRAAGGFGGRNLP